MITQNDINVIFEGDSFFVVEKPAGLVTTSSETQTAPSLEDLLRQDFGINTDRGGVVHRLDKDTSGLLLVAKTTEALEKLQAQFKKREVKKTYMTLVHGFLSAKGRVDVPIGRNPGDREKFVADPSLSNAREAVTEYEPVGNFKFSISNFQSIFNDLNKIQTRKLERSHYGEFTLLQCYPQTGRTHQIRVHLKYLGFPVVGDDKYGGRRISRLDRRWCPRQFLHAAKLEFINPDTNEKMVLESKIPEDLEKALGILEKVDG